MSTNASTMRGTVAYLAYRFVRWLGFTLPVHRGRRIFGRAGLLAHDLLPGLRGTVAANQAQLLGRPASDPLVRASTRDAFAAYGRYWFDSFNVARRSDDWMLERLRPVDDHHLFDPLEAGTGVIVAMPHVGNWDAAGRWLVAKGHRCISVAEELEPPELFALFKEHREQMGMDILALTDPNVGRRLSSALADDRVVSLVADRDLTGRGVQVSMFGRSRTLPAGPALLSLTSGAPLITAACYQTADGWLCQFRGPLRVEPSGDRRKDVVALTELLAAELECLISAAPSDWHVFQPGWPEPR